MLTLKLAIVVSLALTTAAIAAEQAAPSAPGVAPSAATGPAKPAKAAAAPKDKLICVTEQQVGTKIAKKVCRTAERVDEDRATALRTSENLRSKAPDSEGDIKGPAGN